MSIDILIPVYNEAENIRETLTRIHNEVRLDYRVGILYDFDQDTTLPVAQKVATEIGLPIFFVKNKIGKGVLNAIKSGFEAATSEYVVVTMADLSDPPAVINEMVKTAKAADADIVCASRYMKGGAQIGGPFIKSLLSKWAGLSLNFLAGLPTHDVTNNFKLYRKSFLQSVVIESSGGFELGMELVVKAFRGGYKIAEVPSTWRDRTHGSSRFQLFRWLPKYLKWYFCAFGPKVQVSKQF